MSRGHAALRFLRKIHLYVGVFTTPALLFFAITGAMQTFSLHETTQGSSYKPPAWIASLAQLHKKQTTEVPPRKLRPPASDNGGREAGHDADQDAGREIGHKSEHKGKSQPDAASGAATAAAEAANASPATSAQAPSAQAPASQAQSGVPNPPKAFELGPGPQKRHWPMKIFFLVVSVSLLLSVLTGIYMAYKYSRNGWVLTGLLVTGVVVPLVLLPF